MGTFHPLLKADSRTVERRVLDGDVVWELSSRRVLLGGMEQIVCFLVRCLITSVHSPLLRFDSTQTFVDPITYWTLSTLNSSMTVFFQ